MKKRVVSILCIFSMLLGSFAGIIPVGAETVGDTGGIIEASDLPLRLWYDEPAPITSTENSPAASSERGGSDIGWEQYSLPLGNGYLGANVFGRTETERIQLTDKTLANNYGTFGDTTDAKARHGGLNNFSETYIDFGHASGGVSEYVRYLDLGTAISGVSYVYDGVNYTREYFASYPDKALVIRLDADKAGKLDFTLRPTVPYKQSYMATVGDKGGKTGTVTSSVSDGVGYIELSGKLENWDVDFLGLYKVYTEGGTVTASTAEDTYTDTDGTVYTDINGTIRVEGATSAYIVVTIGTDYELSSETFTASNTKKPTFNTTLEDTRVKVGGYMSALESRISGLSFENAYKTLKETHLSDYDALFGRVSLEINPDRAELETPTDVLLSQYKAGDHSYYLETLMFQYGRYLLIASSREGTLPANLQGTWNTYETPPWKSGYWHNINVQMNYWPTFSTNLAELFRAYVDFNQAYMAKAEANATSIIKQYNSTALDKDGGNGWCIGVGNDAYNISSDRSAGNLGFTTQLYWDYYSFTRDEAVLELVLDVLLNAARFITKSVELDEDGNYLVSYCDSPEVHVDGIWYYTKGTTYAQTFAYLNNYNALAAAKAMGIDLSDTELLSREEYSVLSTVMEQIDRYDPIHVGLSGQIKEFREEDYYSSVGDDPNHRHVSQLVGLYPGDLINGTTPAWLDAAKATLGFRGGNTTGGWVYTHKMALYARAKDGDGAGERLSELLSRKTCPNLFTLLWSVYQIDASLGATAGIAEMLLQSHAGYIEPLAAIPSDWTDGSYTGLVARGNFEVSAEWKNGVATCFNITSNKGGRASVYYPSITGATVTDASGKAVSFTVDGTDLISFDTAEGETYVIYGFKAVEKPDAAEKVSFTRVETFGTFDIVWSEVEGARSYNVYVAVENAPAYTLIGSTTGNHFRYTPAAGKENARTTFAVTAVNADGIESERTLCYYNPTDTSAEVTEVYGNVVESGQLQIIVIGNDNCGKYILHEKAEGASGYAPIYESRFPILYAEGYNASSAYAVSAVSDFDGAESELFVITSLASGRPVYDPANILLDKEFVKAEGCDAISAQHDYSCLTDGIIDLGNIHNGRFSSARNGVADGTVDLGGVYKLYELRFYLYEKTAYQMGDNFTLQVYSGGKWVNILDNVSNETLVSDYLVKVGDGKADWILTVDMGGIEASRIRFRSESIPGTQFPYVTFYECECTGIYLRSADGENILLGKEFVGEYATNVDSHTTYGYDKLTDGIIDTVDYYNGRFSNAHGKRAAGTVNLGGAYVLSELRFYLYGRGTAQMGTDFTVEVYSNGEWIPIVRNLSNEELINNYLVDHGTGKADLVLTFPMGDVVASKIRFDAAPSSGWITFYECECYGYELAKGYDNLFEGKTFVGKYNAISGYTYDKLTDGIIDTKNYSNGRFSNVKGQRAGGTVDLGRDYMLSELRFYLYNRQTNTMGDGFTVEVYSNGRWRPIVKNVPLETLISDYLVEHSTAKDGLVLTFPLGNIVGSQIRFDTGVGSSGYATFYECECSGFEIPASYSDNVLLGREFVSEYPSHYDSKYPDRSYAYGNLTDGVIDASNVHNGRFSNRKGSNAGGTLDLGGNYMLSELRFYLFERNTPQLGTDFTLEVYSNGEWVTVIDKASNETMISNYLVECGTGKADHMVIVPLGNIIGSKIRFSAAPVSGGYITLYECECSGYALFDRKNEVKGVNVLSGADVTVSGGTVSAVNTAANAIDGRADTYLEVTGTGEYTLDINFKLNKPLYTLTVYELIDATNLLNVGKSTASPETTVEVYTGGKWVKLAVAPLTGAGRTVFDLYGIEASAIRITFKNTRLFNGETEYRAARISEITCTSGSVGGVDRIAMIKALEKLAAAAGEDGFRYLYDENFLTFKEYATDFAASQTTVDGYADKINAYCDEMTENPNYLVCFNYVDESGGKLAPSVYKYISAGEDFKAISPAIDGYYTRDIYIQGVMGAEGKTVNTVYYPIPDNADADTVEKLLSDIVAWGDSITAGAGSNNVTSAEEYGIALEALGSVAGGANYVTVLKNLIMSRIYGGIAVDGCGVGGEASSTIASRADTETYYLYLDGEVTIGNAAVTVPLTHYASGGRVGILRQGGGAHVNPVTVKGYDANGNEISVVGNISISLTDDAPAGTDIRTCDAKYLKYTFTRTDGGTDALTFVSGARVITKASYLYDGRTCIIFMGENGGYSDLDELIKQQEEILAACGDPEYFLIISSTSGSNESRKEIREALTARWGENYINMGDELNSSRASYELAGYSKEVIDSIQANIDEGTVTALLLADRCHPNAVGYAVAGNVIFERLYGIGAFDAVIDYYDHLNGLTEHSYDDDFDTDCNVCGEVREVEIITSGEVSRKIFWAFEDGVLTVTGRGKIKNFSAGITPWSHLADQITKVVIGEGITYIGSSAFYCCANIESVELPESLTAMGNYVFYGCSALKSIEIPAAVTEIGKYSFRRSGLETIDFAIGYGWSAGDKEFSIADIVSGGHRFISKSYYKQTWVRNTEAPVETLDPNYVAGGIMHTDVIWELTDIGNGNLKLTLRGNGAMADFGTAGAPWYAYWEQITEIEIQEGVTYVGRCAFYGLKFVRKATVADSVTAIGDYGFYMCRLLKSIELPENITIGKDAFVKTGVTV